MKDDRARFRTKYAPRPEANEEFRTEAALEPISTPPPPKASPKRRRIRVALGLGVTVIALAALARLWPSPSEAMPLARAWDIKVSSGGTRSVVAFVYGKEAGFQLVRIPPKGSSRVIPARLGEAPVFMVSLGWSEIVASGEAPPGEPPVSWGASGRVVQTFSNNRGTGVRVW